MNLAKLIKILFGKPCEYDGTLQSKFTRFGYWFIVLFYAFFVLFMVIACILSKSFIPGAIIAILIFPPFSRFVYWVNLKLNGLKREA
jgi:hypothetical protein